MTESEAIKRLEMINDALNENFAEADECSEAIQIGISAIEKKIPQKPINKMYSFYPHSTVLKSKYGNCPFCKSLQVDDEYCANCGQKLDWSDEE